MDAAAWPLIAIAGPTAAGKSQLALALWERLAGAAEIISVDSAQIYRGMDIGTAKPDAATRARVPHHLLDILDPAESYSAARFAADARRLIAQIRARGRVPLLVGGTLLYFRALFEGLSPLPQAHPALREQLARQAAQHGWPALHVRLAALDPQTAARLHPNDAQRIGRALEICLLSGLPASRLQALRGEPLSGPVLRVAVCPTHREVLARRIEARLRAMVEAGFVEEVARLRARGDLHAGLPSMRALGYRQLWQYLEGECSLPTAIERAIAASRRYAKRQLTWLKSEPHWRRLDATEPNAAALVLEWIRRDLPQGGDPLRRGS
jgi:tRNA dimethylallyltransferase